MTVYPFVIHLGPLEITGYGLMLMVAFLMGGWLIALQLRQARPQGGLRRRYGRGRGHRRHHRGQAVVCGADRRSGRPVLPGRPGLVRRIHRRRAGGNTQWLAAAGADPLDHAAGRAGAGGGLCAWAGSAASWSTTTTAGPPIFPGESSSPRACRLRPPKTCKNLFGSPCPRQAWIPATVLAVHPTQLYEVGGDAGRLCRALVASGRTAVRSAGCSASTWSSPGSSGFWSRFLRAKDDRLLGPFTLAQLTSVIIVLHRHSH